MSDVPIYRRSFRQILVGALNPIHYSSLAYIFSYRRPADMFVRRYLLGKGGYPTTALMRVRGWGSVPIGLRSRYDVLTVNEIFVWKCYPCRGTEALILDLGANAGISMAFFLSKAARCRVVGVEPLQENITQARLNLAQFGGRADLIEAAVMDYDGFVELGVEVTGRYSGIEQMGGVRRSVKCIDADRVIRELVAAEGPIDLLKIDVEGAEAAILGCLTDEAFAAVRAIAVEGEKVPFARLAAAGYTHRRHSSGVHWFERRDL